MDNGNELSLGDALISSVVGQILTAMQPYPQKVSASTQYGMGLVVTGDNRIVFRDDALTQLQRSQIAELVNLSAAGYDSRCSTALCGAPARWYRHRNRKKREFKCDTCLERNHHAGSKAHDWAARNPSAPKSPKWRLIPHQVTMSAQGGQKS